MTADERERMFTLCGQIVEENDSAKFLQLVSELADLLERNDQRLKASSKIANPLGQSQKQSWPT